jgi:hypothetical protein
MNYELVHQPIFYGDLLRHAQAILTDGDPVGLEWTAASQGSSQ